MNVGSKETPTADTALSCICPQLSSARTLEEMRHLEALQDLKAAEAWLTQAVQPEEQASVEVVKLRQQIADTEAAASVSPWHPTPNSSFSFQSPALKGTNLRGQTEPKRRFSLILADSR